MLPKLKELKSVNGNYFTEQLTAPAYLTALSNKVSRKTVAYASQNEAHRWRTRNPYLFRVAFSIENRLVHS